MYLSQKSIHRFDNLIKDFEVAYRSFVISEIKRKFPKVTDLQSTLMTTLSQLDDNTLLNSIKYKMKIQFILKDINAHYNTIESCHRALINKSIPDESRVPYVSLIIDYIELLFEPYFRQSELLKGFQDRDFFKCSYDFHKVRNDLSHPASSRISISTAKEITQFIEKILLNLDNKYFWYASKSSIKDSVNAFLNTLNLKVIKITNVSEVAFTHKKLIHRNSELAALREMIFGKNGFSNYRKARSIVIYGYGGVGKTALVLEFVNEILKQCADDQNSLNLDFLLYFTAKEEELILSNSDRSLQINEVKKQVSSESELIEHLFKYLGITSKSELNGLKGILVIDNIETLKDEKAKIIELVQTLPESIQVIITSREEEIADSKMALKGFEKIQEGAQFIKEYIDEYGLNISYDIKYENIVAASKGNTLILVLSLLRLHESSDSYKEIVNELSSTSSASMNTVANFMYKNTFDQAIRELETKGINPKRILSVIAYYSEPIDLYALAKLSGINNLSTIELACEILLQKLVLTKKTESYEINEFASKFIIVKIIPNRLEAQRLNNMIADFKFERRRILRNLEDNRSNIKLNKIMQDWYPRNSLEKIAIAEAYDLYSIARGDGQHKYKIDKQQEIKKRFREIESYSQHPYVKFQKARIYLLFLEKSFNKEHLAVVTKSYEDAIFSIKFDYQYILNTQSYAVVLWLYATYLVKQFSDYSTATRYLEEAKDVCESLNLRNDNSMKITSMLRQGYNEMYKKTKDKNFLRSRDQLFHLNEKKSLM